ncbi:DUF1573 domain-containing protein [Robertkochia marina]|uniref:DUF1573 domain-containing protein n=1 Tax=Robertkochia marina TaxID=1227945 RepID=A0A4V3UXV5_9FLAO|nr:DUF1573 domain-containing protein [Robertkochia marina]THD65830.1 DUF1573 domain-containing protein [Robertkochia marina]TRZ41333.1 DUF1573 domain-containing protein [Robertkochia marina]
MKRAILLSGMVALMAFTSCKDDASSKIKSENVEMAQQRDEANAKVPAMTFDQTEHDFGTIAKGTAVEKVFTFTNTGDAPLVITDASSSCGCTIPEYPKNEPIAPGESGEILVKFNGSGMNEVTKTVRIIANTEKGTEQLKIKAFVEAQPAQ